MQPRRPRQTLPHRRTHADYALEHSVHDMLDLLAHDRAIWVGHDWGSPFAWNLASHHPERCQAVVNFCVPHIASGFASANLIALVNREIYPEATYPAGQCGSWRNDHSRACPAQCSGSRAPQSSAAGGASCARARASHGRR
jgi:pimeloyl-ACP methyl ester carboxylesterase